MDPHQEDEIQSSTTQEDSCINPPANQSMPEDTHPAPSGEKETEKPKQLRIELSRLTSARNNPGLLEKSVDLTSTRRARSLSTHSPENGVSAS